MSEYYVCPSNTTITTLQNGTVQNPWKMNAIPWVSILPGDEIRLLPKFGASNFQESFTIATSGDETNRVKILTAPGESEKAEIDGSNTKETLAMNSRHYLEISDISCKNALYYCFRNELANGNLIINCDAGNAGRAGFYIKSGTGFDIQNCTANTPTGTYAALYIGVGVTSATLTDLTLTCGKYGLWLCNYATIKRIDTVAGEVGLYTDNIPSGTTTVEDSAFSDATVHNIWARNSPNINIKNITSTNPAYDGIRFEGATTTNCTVERATVDMCGQDGISFSDNAKNSTIIGNRVTNCGQRDVVGYGDGITAHDGCTGLKVLSNILIGNRNSGVAVVTTSSGVAYNNTILNNGDSTSTNMGVRGGFYYTPTTAGGWVFKNNICKDNYPYEINCNATGWAGLTPDRNCYSHVLDSNFANIGAGAITWTQYHTTAGYEPNSINVDPQVSLLGKTSSNSPCIDTGAFIAGSNMEGQADPWGRKVYGIPNIGADQGVGSPKPGDRQEITFSVGFYS